jgi:hypothetical protein
MDIPSMVASSIAKAAGGAAGDEASRHTRWVPLPHLSHKHQHSVSHRHSALQWPVSVSGWEARTNASDPPVRAQMIRADRIGCR